MENGRHFAGRRNPAKSYTKWIDYDIIKCGLCVRTRQSGDYLVIDDQGETSETESMVYQREDPEGRKRQDASCRRRKPYCVDTGIQDEQSVQSDRKDKKYC